MFTPKQLERLLAGMSRHELAQVRDAAILRHDTLADIEPTDTLAVSEGVKRSFIIARPETPEFHGPAVVVTMENGTRFRAKGHPGRGETRSFIEFHPMKPKRARKPAR